MSNTSDDEICFSALMRNKNEFKRRVHNSIEKRRKDRINTWIYKLEELLPFNEPKRESKGLLLERIYNYIVALKDKNDKLMFGHINSVHGEEIRCLAKRVKELEEINANYYRLLQIAGISPNCSPHEIWDRRPTKYSNKITPQQMSALFSATFGDSSSNKTSKTEANSRTRTDDSESSDQTEDQIPVSCAKIQKSKNRSKKRKTLDFSGKSSKKVIELKKCRPTPLLPNTANTSTSNNNINNNNLISGSTNLSNNAQSNASYILLNDNSVNHQTGDTPRLITVNSGNTLNAIQGLQLRPTVAAANPLQLLSAMPALDASQLVNKLFSGQFIFGMNTQPQPPPPQTAGVLLPNGQVLPIITQPPPQQQSFVFASNNGLFLNQSQQPSTIITGQTANLSSNIAAKVIQLSTTAASESQTQPNISNPKKSVKTTTIETIPMSPKPTISGSINKKRFRKIIVPKGKFYRRDSYRIIRTFNDKKRLLNGNKTLKTDNKIINNNNAKNVSNVREIDASNRKRDDSLKEKVSATTVAKASNGAKSSKSDCDILAEATQTIFSPLTPKKGALSERIIRQINANDDIISDKIKDIGICERTVVSNANQTNQNEVIAKYSDNKAIGLVNDTDNDNDAKLKHTIASGKNIDVHKSNTDLDNFNNSNNGINTSDNLIAVGKVVSKSRNESNVCLSSNTSSPDNSSNTTNTLTFGLCSAQIEVNGNVNAIENESELPLLLSSLTDENDASAESVHSVSNSSLPAFLSLSPEHLTEYLPKDTIANSDQSSSINREPLSDNSVQFRLNRSDGSIDHHSSGHDNQIHQTSHKEQSFSHYSKNADVVPTSQTESSGYSTNFSSISASLRNTEYADFATDKLIDNNGSNTHNYVDSITNTNINKVMNQNNNFLQFSFQNDNTFMPLYPSMHSYTNNVNNNANRDINFNTNLPVFNPVDSSLNLNNTHTQSNASENPTQSRAQQQNLAKQTQPHSQHTSQPQTQSNVLPIRTHRNASASATQLQSHHNSNVRQEHQKLSSQSSRDNISTSKTATTTSTHNKSSNSSESSAHFSTSASQNTFSGFSTESLLRPIEPSLNQNISETNNRYNNGLTSRLHQPSHKEQTFAQCSKSSEVIPTSQTDSNGYSANFSSLAPNLRSAEFADFASDKLIDTNGTNTHNYVDSITNTNINKVMNQNNFLQFSFQNDNTFMPTLYPPMPSYSNNMNANINRDINFNASLPLFNPVDSSILINNPITQPNTSHNPTQSRSQQQQQNLTKQTQQHSQQSNVLPIRTHRNASASAAQLQTHHSAVRQEHQKHPTQTSRDISAAKTSTTTSTHNKVSNSNVSTVQYSTSAPQNTFSLESLMRPNESSLNQNILETHNRYNNGLSPRVQQTSHKEQSFSNCSKSNEVVPTSQTESSGYSNNFSSIAPNLRNTEFADFATDKLVDTSGSNSHNYMDSITNPNINKVMNQNNNFLQFPFPQNDNTFMPLYPAMHSHVNTNINRDINFNTNLPLFNPVDSSLIINNPTTQSNSTQPRPQQQQQQQQQQQTLAKQTQPHSQHSSQSQTQANVLPIRTHRNSSASAAQLQSHHSSIRQDHQKHPSQASRNTISTPKSATTTSTHNKLSNINSNTNTFTTFANTFSSYSLESLGIIRPNEQPLNQSNHETHNRYNNNGISGRVQQQTQQHSSLNMNFAETSGVRSSSRNTISYSAESLIQPNSINNSNQINFRKFE